MKLTLPNAAGGSVRLVDADGTELDRADYPAAVEAQSWSRFGASWGWTDHVTPGNANHEPSAAGEAKANKTNTNASSTKELKPLHLVTIPEVQELDSGDRVQLRGRVTVAVDLLGKGITYLQSPEGGISIQLGLHAPVLSDGKTVDLTGTVRISNGRRRITVASTDTVRVLASDISADPKTMNTGDVDEGEADELVHMHGVVASVTGNHFEVDDGSGTVPVYIKSSTGIVRPKVKMGDTADVIGIVSASSTGIRVLPRTKDDLRIERVLGATTTTTQTLPTAPKNQTSWYWILAALGGLAAGAKPLWMKWKEHQNAG